MKNSISYLLIVCAIFYCCNRPSSSDKQDEDVTEIIDPVFVLPYKVKDLDRYHAFFNEYLHTKVQFEKVDVLQPKNGILIPISIK
ncbi:MAG: hypothetical protein K0R51_1063 [Cytophagaceae bacterium]|jgi:hypothetical protein|nr:hypothetical protein [Cytophagaceae bacterium]